MKESKNFENVYKNRQIEGSQNVNKLSRIFRIFCDFDRFSCPKLVGTPSHCLKITHR